MKIAHIKNDKAFTLLELVIALLVFLIGVLGVLQLLALTVNFNQRNRDISICTSLAQAKVDELLQYAFNSSVTDSRLDRGGVIPTTPYVSPLPPANPAPVGGFSDFYDLNSNLLTKTAVTKGTTQPIPGARYYVVEWQICDGCTSTQPTACTAGTPVCASGENVLKKITVTVTAMSPLLGRSLPTATIVAYRSRLD